MAEAQDTPAEEQAPATEETKEEEPKKSIFASFCGCFGGKSAVVEGEKPEAEDTKDSETEKPAEDKPAEDKPEETEVSA
eukprot:jgi/Psemu1/45542/gm1.45542_g